jgi:hypothetical protein
MLQWKVTLATTKKKTLKRTMPFYDTGCGQCKKYYIDFLLIQIIVTLPLKLFRIPYHHLFCDVTGAYSRKFHGSRLRGGGATLFGATMIRKHFRFCLPI